MNSRGESAFLGALGMTCAAGTGAAEIMANLLIGASPGMARSERFIPGLSLTVGEVDAPPSLADFDTDWRTRNNALALQAVRQIEAELLAARETYGPGRIAVAVGTTTSGMAETEAAFADLRRGEFPRRFTYAQQEMGAPAEFLAMAFGLKGPAFTISTACTSSAKALASARRLLRLGVCDAVLAGGVDTLCAFTLRGFSALGAVSPDPTLPFSAHRRGINIGEGAAFFLVARDGPVRLAGAGETSDAYNVSAPSPGGEGARDAMAQALRQAGIRPEQVDYVNLHGTGTSQNDAMEALAMNAIFPAGVPCSSTKPLTGHTLGAAGALEAGFCWALLDGLAPGKSGGFPAHVYDGAYDPALKPLDLVAPGRSFPRPRRAMSNVFGFGGTNVSLLLEAA